MPSSTSSSGRSNKKSSTSSKFSSSRYTRNETSRTSSSSSSKRSSSAASSPFIAHGSCKPRISRRGMIILAVAIMLLLVAFVQTGLLSSWSPLKGTNANWDLETTTDLGRVARARARITELAKRTQTQPISTGDQPVGVELPPVLSDLGTPPPVRVRSIRSELKFNGKAKKVDRPKKSHSVPPTPGASTPAPAAPGEDLELDAFLAPLPDAPKPKPNANANAQLPTFKKPSMPTIAHTPGFTPLQEPKRIGSNPIPLAPQPQPAIPSFMTPLPVIPHQASPSFTPLPIPLVVGAGAGGGGSTTGGLSPAELHQQDLLRAHYAKMQADAQAQHRTNQPVQIRQLPAFVSTPAMKRSGAVDEAMLTMLRQLNLSHVPEVFPIGRLADRGFILDNEVQVVILTQGTNHPIVTKSLASWGRFVQRVSIFSDTRDEDLGTIVIQDPFPTRARSSTTMEAQSSQSWRISEVLKFLLHQATPAPFYLILSDTSFPLLDVIRQRLDLVKGTLGGMYPPFVGGRKQHRKFVSEVLYADQQSIASSFWDSASPGGKTRKLESVNSFIFGFDTQWLKYVGDYLTPDACPVLVQDDLALAGIVSCAGGHVPGSLFDFFPQTRWMPREYGLSNDSPLEAWRLYDCYHNLNHPLRVEESYSWYYSKLEAEATHHMEQGEAERIENERRQDAEKNRRPTEII